MLSRQQTFHLRDIRWERQFLSKSFLGFLAFNLLPYSLFGAEVSFHFACQTSNNDMNFVDFISEILQQQEYIA